MIYQERSSQSMNHRERYPIHQTGLTYNLGVNAIAGALAGPYRDDIPQIQQDAEYSRISTMIPEDTFFNVPIPGIDTF
jgi:hypothetical protein